MKNDFYNGIIKKVKEANILSKNEFMTFERAIRLDEYHEHLVNVQLGLEENEITMTTVDTTNQDILDDAAKIEIAPKTETIKETETFFDDTVCVDLDYNGKLVNDPRPIINNPDPDLGKLVKYVELHKGDVVAFVGYKGIDKDTAFISSEALEQYNPIYNIEPEYEFIITDMKTLTKDEDDSENCSDYYISYRLFDRQNKVSIMAHDNIWKDGRRDSERVFANNFKLVYKEFLKY